MMMMMMNANQDSSMKRILQEISKNVANSEPPPPPPPSSMMKAMTTSQNDHINLKENLTSLVGTILRDQTQKNQHLNVCSSESQDEFMSNYMRKRFYSCSTTSCDLFDVDFDLLDRSRALSESTNPNNQQQQQQQQQANMAHVEAFKQYRHNSIIGTSAQNVNTRYQQRALSFNNSNNNNNNNNKFNIQQQQQQQQKHFYQNKYHHFKHPSTFPCLSPSCVLLTANRSENNFDKNLVRFGCNSCQTIRYMHALCYKESCGSGEQLNVNANSQINNKLKTEDGSKLNQHEFPCTNCLNGLVQKLKQQKWRNNTNNANNANTNNNPPLPVPMQPVHELSISYNNHNHNHYKQTTNKRQSAPVNMTTTPKNRCRTMSTGTSSSSFSSSFSSSSCNFSIGSPPPPPPPPPTTDAECLNKMLATMSSKLHITSSSDSNKLEEKLASTGNIFYSRGHDYSSILARVPFVKQNGIMLRLEDEGPYGNDETRCFVLSHFSSLCVREMKCVICDCNLAIYDKFPLLDGTLFVSPIKYTDLKSYDHDDDTQETKAQNDNDNDHNDHNEASARLYVPAVVSNKSQFIYAICLSCLHSKNNDNDDHDDDDKQQIKQIKCTFCQQTWQGASSLQIGTMYKFEIFSAFPCCQRKLNCSKCNAQIVNLSTTGGLQYFSSYSEERECHACKTKDFHFIKPLNKFYDILNKKLTLC
jgi:hypothetical protein